MATYIVLCNFERAGIEELMGPTGDVAQKAKALMQHVGGNIEAIWLTTGGFDLVLVVDAPDPGKALAFVAAFSSVGGVNTQTLTAEKEVGEVVKAALAAKTGFGKTGFGEGENG